MDDAAETEKYMGGGSFGQYMLCTLGKCISLCEDRV